jgi:hypothetical protein
MKIINLHVEIECSDDSVDKGLVADFICKSVNKKFKKVSGVIVYNSKKIIAGHRKKEK